MPRKSPTLGAFILTEASARLGMLKNVPLSSVGHTLGMLIAAPGDEGQQRPGIDSVNG